MTSEVIKSRPLFRYTPEYVKSIDFSCNRRLCTYIPILLEYIDEGSDSFARLKGKNVYGDHTTIYSKNSFEVAGFEFPWDDGDTNGMKHFIHLQDFKPDEV